MVETTALEITFVDAVPPPLPAGDFVLKTTQELSWQGGSAPSFSSDYAYTVNGPRFTIDPNLVISMFPPPGNRGHFQKYLPQMVFGRRSVPWERTVDNSVPQDKPFIPWLWLLSLDEDELAANSIAVKTIDLKFLFTPENPRILVPDLLHETSDGDPETTQLLVLDVPTALINQLVPSKEDIVDMAGARIVSIANKDLSAATVDGWYSVLMGNRFPRNGRANTQFLVSMEGYGTAKTNIFYPNQVDPAKYDAVRFVMFMSWTYTNVDDGQTFDQLMNNLSAGRLQVPNQSPDSTVTNAFNLGFAALDHNTRIGEQTVSWYRGPLLPMLMPKNPPPDYPDGNYPNSDAALRFDPEYGMFDVSYAAAWQLGRLLGMQDGNFASAIARLRDRNVAAMNTLASRSLLAKQLNAAAPLSTARDFKALLSRRFLDRAIGEMWGSVVGPALVRRNNGILGTPADPSGLREHMQSIPSLLSDEELEELLSGKAAATDLLDALITRIFEAGRRR